MKSEELTVGHLLCVKSKMAWDSLSWDPFGEKSSPPSGNPDPCLARDLVMPLKRKGYDQALPWHLGREGLIYSIQVQELALLVKRLYLLSRTGSELMGSCPSVPSCAVSYLFQSVAADVAAVCDFFPMPSWLLTCRLSLLDIGLVGIKSGAR